MSIWSLIRKQPADAVVRDFIRHNVPKSKRFVRKIDEDDEMFLFNLQLNKGDRRRTQIEYYMIGWKIFDAIKQIATWHSGSVGQIGKFLDFGCGYGRSTRFLIQELPPQRVWAADIYSDAVKFQRRQYGVNGIVSVPDPADFPTDVNFDFIFACSFFSHMPEPTFNRWLETLYRLLTPGGILVFTTHDISLIPPSAGIQAKGIWFMAHSESRTIDKNQYGTAYVDEDFVAEVVHRVTGGNASLHRIKKGLCSFQDIYIVANDRNRDFSDLSFVHFPQGHLDACNRTPNGDVDLAGWAADSNDGGSIADVQILAGGRVVQKCSPSNDRVDVAELLDNPAMLRSGWSCRLKRHHAGANQIVEVKVLNKNQKSSTIFYNYIADCSPGSSPRRVWKPRTMRSITKKILPTRVYHALAILKNGVPPTLTPG